MLIRSMFVLCAAVLAFASQGEPVVPAFTYQGELRDSSGPADGMYEMRFRAYDMLSGGSQVGVDNTLVVSVSEGRFSVDLDFGDVFMGDAVAIEIAVRPDGSADPFTVLSPRQSIQPTPYALFALDGNPGPQGPAGPQGPEGPEGPAGTTSWTGLDDIPAGFADDIDNNTTYSAGTGLSLNGTIFSANTSYLQRRVSASAPLGQYIRVINADGTVVTGFDQDTNTTYSAGTGIALNGTIFSIANGGVGPNQLATNQQSLERVSGGLFVVGATNQVTMPSSLNKLGVGQATAATGTIQAFTGADVSATDSDGFLVLGLGTGPNIGMDDNEIQARNNQAAAPLNLNVSGGNVLLSQTGSATSLVGVGQSSPSDKLHVTANAGQPAFRVQAGSTTRLRVNANGGVSLGANNTSVPAGDTFVQGSLGIGDSTPNERLHVVAPDEFEDGILIDDGGSSAEALFAPRRMSANNNYDFRGDFDLRFDTGDDFLVFSQSVVDLNADSDIMIDSERKARIDGATEIEMNSASSIDMNATLDVDIDLGNRFDVAAGGIVDIDGSLVDIESTQFNGSLVGIGVPASGFNLTVNGTAAKPGGGLWAVFSDRRLKREIKPMGPVLDRLLDLEGVSFEYADPDHISYVPGAQRGWIAQQVRDVFPEWVEEGEDGYLYITVTGYEAMMVEAIRELRAEKDTEMDALRAENADLRARLERLELLLQE